jgi:hypothetical protein
MKREKKTTGYDKAKLAATENQLSEIRGRHDFSLPIAY